VPAIEPTAAIELFSIPSLTKQTKKFTETYEVIAVVIKN
jgi:hypothetical protein